jgi:hypothetical protein
MFYRIVKHFLKAGLKIVRYHNVKIIMVGLLNWRLREIFCLTPGKAGFYNETALEVESCYIFFSTLFRSLFIRLHCSSRVCLSDRSLREGVLLNDRF